MTPALTPPPLAELADVRAGLAELTREAPLWPVPAGQWRALVAAVGAFEGRWGEPAGYAGWHPVALFGLHPRAPFASIAAMGAAWLIALREHRVIAIDPRRIEVITRTAARLSIYRTDADNGAVLAWMIRCV